MVILGAEGVVLEGGAVEGDDAGDAFEPVGGEDGGDVYKRQTPPRPTPPRWMAKS